MKKFNDMMKDLQEQSGLIKDMIGPTEIELFHRLASKISSAYHHDIKSVLTQIELDLNKFAYTMGELDLDGLEDEDTAEEDYLIFSHADKNTRMRNGFITLNWEKLDSGQQMLLRVNGGSLNYRVNMTFNSTTPQELDDLVTDLLGEDIEENEEELNLSEDVSSSTLLDKFKIRMKHKQTGALKTASVTATNLKGAIKVAKTSLGTDYELHTADALSY